MKSSLLSSIENVFNTMADHVAVVDCYGEPRTYRDLSSRVARLQNLFPIDEPRVIGIYLDYETKLVEAVLAVIRSGATAVPVEPGLDVNEAKAHFLNRGVEFVITDSHYARVLSGFLQIHVSETALSRVKEAAPEDVDENTVGISSKDRKFKHSEIADLSDRMMKNGKITSADSVLLTSEIGSVGFVRELFGTLLSGSTLVVLPAEGRYDGRKTIEFAEAEGVTVLPVTAGLKSQIETRRLSVPRSIRLYGEPADCVANTAFGSTIRFAE